MKVFVSQIAPLLDGTRNWEEIAGALPGYSQASVLSFLGLLEQTGLIEQVADTLAVRSAGVGRLSFFASGLTSQRTPCARSIGAAVAGRPGAVGRSGSSSACRCWCGRYTPVRR